MTEEAEEWPELPSEEAIAPGTEVLEILQQMERVMGRLIHKRMMLLLLEGEGFEEDAAAMGVNPAILKGRREVYDSIVALIGDTGKMGIEDAAFHQMWGKAIDRILLLIKPLCFQEED